MNAVNGCERSEVRLAERVTEGKLARQVERKFRKHKLRFFEKKWDKKMILRPRGRRGAKLFFCHGFFSIHRNFCFRARKELMSERRNEMAEVGHRVTVASARWSEHARAEPAQAASASCETNIGPRRNV